MGKGGKKLKIPQQQPGPLETEQAAALRGFRTGFQEPLRGQLQPEIFQGFRQAGLFTPQISPFERDVAAKQFGATKENLLQTSPARGGRLQAQMLGLDRGLAETVSGLGAQAQARAQDRLASLLPSAFPSAATTIGAGEQLAGGERARTAQNIQNRIAGQQALGGGIGGLIGSGLGLLGNIFGAGGFPI